MPSPYFPHAIYSLAIITLSIHLVSQRRLADDERAHIAAQTSILESIRDQLKSNKPLSNEELTRLRRLARPVEHKDGDEGASGRTIGWGEIFLGRKKEEGAARWEKKETEKLHQDMSK
ncbi:hypothetical protein E4T56_gene12412 [Termitomyces sp. T112]|nr:hypothetical protein E4T56_gene12412 [Termitomyces sp. T112]KAH0583016.1 hypothetical protein H2248_010903 [Termitomyces sp. 'cryptogamus']